MEVACAVVRLNPDSVPKVREWVAYMARNREAALQTLRAEGVSIESVFLESSELGDSLVYYMRSISQEQAQAVANRSAAAIDEYHRAFKKNCWAEVRRLELLLDLSAN